MFVDACRESEQQTGAAILIVHHTGKGTSDTYAKPTERGSSALRGAADVMIEQEAKGIIIVSNDKQKDEEELSQLPCACAEINLVSIARQVARLDRAELLRLTNSRGNSRVITFEVIVQIAQCSIRCGARVGSHGDDVAEATAGRGWSCSSRTSVGRVSAARCVGM